MLQSPIAADGFATQRETNRTGQACIHWTSFIGRVPFTFPWLGWKHFSHGVWHRKYHKAEPHNAQCHIFSLLDSGRGVAKLLTAAVQGTEFTDSVTWHLPPLPPKHFERDATGFIRITPHWKQFSKRQVAVSCYCYEIPLRCLLHYHSFFHVYVRIPTQEPISIIMLPDWRCHDDYWVHNTSSKVSWYLSISYHHAGQGMLSCASRTSAIRRNQHEGNPKKYLAPLYVKTTTWLIHHLFHMKPSVFDQTLKIHTFHQWVPATQQHAFWGNRWSLNPKKAATCSHEPNGDQQVGHERSHERLTDLFIFLLAVILILVFLNSFGSQTISFCMILKVMCLKPSRSYELEISYFLHSFYILCIFFIFLGAQQDMSTIIICIYTWILASKHPGWAMAHLDSPRGLFWYSFCTRSGTRSKPALHSRKKRE